ncbi:MAG TPA: TolC family protein, partial [Tahibacter sp.]|uniref:TolC family protein n=1 Tax=Tahibacter sp. TaxID=2056211 RepID=UPI002BA7104B
MLSRFRVRRRSVRAAAVVLFFPSGAFAAGFSFDDALQRAVEHAPLLDARRSQREAAHEDAARADALPDPRLTLGFVNLPVTGADAFDLRADDMTMRQLGLMQDVPSRVKRRARRELAERLDAQAESLSTAERLAVRRDVAQVWIALWAAQREAGALRALREPTAVAAQTAKARLAGGTGSAADALAAAAASLELDDRIDAADAALQAARAGLAR